jgi:hypothetical protein
MFYDWLKVFQDFDFALPLIGDRAHLVIDTETQEILTTTQPSLKHEGSFCTSINIRISGNRLTVDGNPSRINRLDNLFGLTSLQQCIFVYNCILRDLGLPEFTRCTRVFHHQGSEGKRATTFSDGATIQELHITSNRAVGRGCVDDYLRGLATLHYRYMEPRLHTNGKTTDWLSSRNHEGKASSLIYPSVYNKDFELRLHLLPKIERKYGYESDEAKYVKQVIDFCELNGVARFEQKLKSAFLRKYNFRFYGLFDESDLISYHEEFLNLDNKLQVTAMTLENISELLIREGYCKGTRAANTSTMYAIQWMHGQTFDFSKTQVQHHRAILRKIGIDIKDKCNISLHSPVYVRKAIEVIPTDLHQPDWYREPTSLRLVA